MKLIVLTLHLLFSSSLADQYPWLEKETPIETLASRIQPPEGYRRVAVDDSSFAHWLRQLPLKPKGTPVKLWNGQTKYNQAVHEAVVDIDFIGKNLQQCVDAIIRLRAEYLRTAGRENEIAFSYSCCTEKIPWHKWREGWRTQIGQENGRYFFTWICSAQTDSSRTNFRNYLFNIMMYAGTLSLARDMEKIPVTDMEIGDAFVQGGAPGYGHGVLVVDMAQSPNGERIVLLGQSYNPAENFNILKSGCDLSPWFRVQKNSALNTPQWMFSHEHLHQFDP